MTYRFLLAVAGALLLAACSGKPPMQTGRSAVVATSPSEIDAIAGLLHEGNRKAARKRLQDAMKRDPMNPSLMLLEQAMTGDAEADLGSTHFSYVVQPGDTMTTLAKRFLGNRLKAYQLARYNGIERPSALATGTVLRIPGQPPRAAPTPRAAPAPRASTASPNTSRKAPAKPAATVATNAAGAKRAHAAGLAALHQGRVSEAVSQLRRAAALAPGNAAIGRYRARADRIAATVRARN